MGASELTLGKALGILKAEQNSIHIPGRLNLTPDEKDFLEALKEKLISIESSLKTANVLEQIPGQRCPLNAPYLLKNEEFFLVLFLINLAEKDCLRLSKHLNDCFHCARIFSEVLREYHQIYQENV